jgi:hypothetical protein
MHTDKAALEESTTRRSFLRRAGTVFAVGIGALALPSVADAKTLHGQQKAAPLTSQCCRQNCKSCSGTPVAYKCTDSCSNKSCCVCMAPGPTCFNPGCGVCG